MASVIRSSCSLSDGLSSTGEPEARAGERLFDVVDGALAKSFSRKQLLTTEPHEVRERLEPGIQQTVEGACRER